KPYTWEGFPVHVRGAVGWAKSRATAYRLREVQERSPPARGQALPTLSALRGRTAWVKSLWHSFLSRYAVAGDFAHPTEHLRIVLDYSMKKEQRHVRNAGEAHGTDA